MPYFNTLSLIVVSVLSFWQCESIPKNDAQLDDQEELLEDQKLNELLKRIQLPEGFSIDLYSDNVPNARSMTLSPSGILYIGTRTDDKVYALEDSNGDGKADKKYIIADNMNTPNGVAFNNGDLYVAEIDKIWKFVDVESNLNKDGSGFEIFAKGVRNSVGFTWHPETEEMWFTDNGRDMLGDNIPPCELNRANNLGMHFGYPYCHGGDIADPTFGGEYSCTEFIAPAQNLGPHVAPLGLKFYTGNMFPEEYQNDIFIAEHGSWNRSKKIGYRIARVKIENGKSVGYEPFVFGWLDESEQEAFGRPVDIIIANDGSMLISDDKAGVIYRLTYSAE